MKTFYQYMMTFRGKRQADDKSMFADWIFHEHDFPQHSNDYDEISDYLEWNSPFPHALIVFDEVWNLYQQEK